MGKLAKINLCYFTFYLPSRKKLPARLRRQSDQRQYQSLAITRSLNFRSVSSVSISGETFFLQITRCPDFPTTRSPDDLISDQCHQWQSVMRFSFFRSPGLKNLARFPFFCRPGLCRVIAFAINRRHFAAHGPQISRKLSAMVDGVVLRKREKTDRRHLEHAAKIDGFNQLLAAQAFNLLQIRVE